MKAETGVIAISQNEAPPPDMRIVRRDRTRPLWYIAYVTPDGVLTRHVSLENLLATRSARWQEIRAFMRIKSAPGRHTEKLFIRTCRD
jgi:hypothetical protein